MTPKVYVIAIRTTKPGKKKPEHFVYLALRGSGHGRDYEWSLVKNRKSAYRFADMCIASIINDWFHEHHWNHGTMIFREIQEMKIPNRGGQHDDND